MPKKRFVVPVTFVMAADTPNEAFALLDAVLDPLLTKPGVRGIEMSTTDVKEQPSGS